MNAPAPCVPRSNSRDASLGWEKSLTRRWTRSLAIVATIAVAGLVGCTTTRTSSPGLERIEHIVVIYAENRSFDNLYGLFPGANGVANANAEQYMQVDNDGKPFVALPPVWRGKDADPAFPANLPNKPFRIDAPPINLPLSVPTPDLIHRYYQNIEQINGGRNDRFVTV